jgi:hypothetical protein
MAIASELCFNFGNVSFDQAVQELFLGCLTL